MPESLQALLERRGREGTAIEEFRGRAYRDGNGQTLTQPREFTAEERAEWTRLNAAYDATNREVELARRSEQIARDQREAADWAREQELRNTSGTPAAGNGAAGGNAGEPRGAGGFDTQEQRDQFERQTRERLQQRGGQATEEDRDLALNAWARSQFGLELDQRHVEACRRAGMRPEQRQLRVPLARSERWRDLQRIVRSTHPSQYDQMNTRALSISGLSAGASLVAESFVRRLEMAMLEYGGMLQVAELIRTTTGEPMKWPTVNDTGNKGRRVGAGVAVATNRDPTTGAQSLNAYKWTSDCILIDQELLEDSAVNLADLLPAMLGERLGRIMNEEMTTGDGSGMPYGIVTQATTGKTCASATAIAADEWIELVHSVDPAYRRGAGFMMNDAVVLDTRLLKDGTGAYLWRSGLQEGVPDRLLGYPITVNQDMASSIASAAVVAVFGRLSSYKVRQVREARIYRLEERYRDSDQDGFVAFIRGDGMLLDAGTHPVKKLVMA